MKIGWMCSCISACLDFFQSDLHSDFCVSKVCLLDSYDTTAFPWISQLCTAHPCMPSPSPMCTILGLTFLWLPTLTTTSAGEVIKLAHSAHRAWQIPHKMMSFRHFLSTFSNKLVTGDTGECTAYQEETIPSCNISCHTSAASAYLLFYKWVTISWDTENLFG